jgi:subfamily B ATP-binding cassette protein MsbA
MISSFVRYLRVFYRYTGRLLPLFIVIATVGGLCEGIGITLFLPFLDQMAGGQGATGSMLSRLLYSLLDRLGVGTTLTGIAWFILGMLSAVAAVKCVQEILNGYLMARLLRELRRRLMVAYASIDYQHSIERDTGYLSNVMTREIEVTVSAFGQFTGIMSGLLYLSVYVMASVVLDWRLWLIAAAAGALLAVAMRWLADISRRFSQLTSEGNAVFQQQLIQFFHFFKYLRATHTMPAVQAALEQRIERLAGYQFRLSSLAGLLRAFSEPIAGMIVMGLLVYQVAVLHRPMAELLVTLLIFYRILQKLLAVQNGWQTFCGSTGSIRMFDETLRDAQAHTEPLGHREPGSFRDAITLQGVSVALDGTTILDRVSLRIPKGQIVAIVGESGSGKSTLLDLITGVRRPSAGQVLLDGMPYSELNLPIWRRRIGFVAQDNVVFQDTLARNITLWACDETRDAECRKRLDMAVAASLLEDVLQTHSLQLNAPVGDRGVKLSGGQRQRLAIARELFRTPELLILDEATSALDYDTEARLQQQFERLRGRMTLVVVAHRLSTIRTCDYLYVLSKGRIIEEGTYEQLLASPDSRFAQLSRYQQMGRETADASAAKDV